MTKMKGKIFNAQELQTTSAWLHKHKQLWEPLHKRHVELLLEIELEKNRGSMGGDETKILSLKAQAHQAMIECAQLITRIKELQTEPDPLIIKIESN